MLLKGILFLSHQKDFDTNDKLDLDLRDKMVIHIHLCRGAMDNNDLWSLV